MLKSSLGVLALCVATQLPAQTNEQTFYNAAQFAFTTATRRSTVNTDNIFFTQPVNFRRGNGKAIGWRVVLQDQDPRTGEQVRLSYHRLGFQSIVPIKTEEVGANFVAFGSGTAGPKAFIYSFTLATEATVPEFSALGIQLPAPISWPADAATIHFQRGDRTKVTAAKRTQWTYKLDGFGNVAGEWRVGSTFRFGGLYRTPIFQIFNGSNAYTGGAILDDLLGPESVEWETGGARTDKLGFRFQGGSKYATVGQQLGVAAVFFSSDYRASKLAVPPFGTFLLDENTTFFLAYEVMDSVGDGRSLTVTVPSGLNGLRIAWQAFYVGIDTGNNTLTDFELSNATRTIFK